MAGQGSVAPRRTARRPGEGGGTYSGPTLQTCLDKHRDVIGAESGGGRGEVTEEHETESNKEQNVGADSAAVEGLWSLLSGHQESEALRGTPW